MQGAGSLGTARGRVGGAFLDADVQVGIEEQAPGSLAGTADPNRRRLRFLSRVLVPLPTVPVMGAPVILVFSSTIEQFKDIE